MYLSSHTLLYVFCSLIRLNIVASNRESAESCGSLTINALNSEFHLVLTEGVKIPHLRFLNITEKLIGASLFVKSGCRVDICGVSANTGTADDHGGCNSFWKPVAILPDMPYNKWYSMTALSCACTKNRVGCESSTCTSDFLHAEDCAALYQEINCQDCYYNPARLKNGDAFKTDGSAAVRSRVVRQGCQLTMKTKGTLWVDGSYDFVYTNNANYMDPTYHIELGGEEFSCICGSMVLPKVTSPPLLSVNTTELLPIPNISGSPVISGVSPSEAIPNKRGGGTNGSYVVYSIVGTIAVIVLIAVVVILIRRHKSPATTEGNPGEICDELAEINSPDFTEGKHDPNPSAATEERIETFCGNFKPDGDGDSSQLKNLIEMSVLSEGHSRALNLPYDSKFEIPRTRFIINVRDVLGQGNYGIVYKGSLVQENESKFEYIDVAIKTLRPFTTPEYIQPLLNEIKVISYIGHHPNIVCFLGACTLNRENGDIYILMEYCSKGNLRKYLRSIKPSPYVMFSDRSDAKLDLLLPQNSAQSNQMNDDLFRQLLNWSAQIAAGMRHLCLKNVIHIDLSARNILLTNELVAKIGDFGLSRKLYSQMSYDKKGSDAIPICWIALESMRDAKYSQKSDVWSYGVVLFEIFSFGDEPYADKSPKEIFAMLNSGKRLPCPKFATEEIYAQMMNCWNEDSESRPSFLDLERFFTDLIARENHASGGE